MNEISACEGCALAKVDINLIGRRKATATSSKPPLLRDGLVGFSVVQIHIQNIGS